MEFLNASVRDGRKFPPSSMGYSLKGVGTGFGTLGG
jgi:hypothetical protein